MTIVSLLLPDLPTCQPGCTRPTNNGPIASTRPGIFKLRVKVTLISRSDRPPKFPDTSDTTERYPLVPD
jgi:hypothetical protein